MFIFLICFTLGFALFWVSPLWFFIAFVGFRIGFERKTKGKLLENQSQPTPGPLRSFLLGLSLLYLLWGSFSGTSPESLLVVWPPLGSSGWLWPLFPLCLLLRVIREKSRKRELREVPEQGEAPKQPQSRLELLDEGKIKRKTDRNPIPADSGASPELPSGPSPVLPLSRSFLSLFSLTP